MSSNRRAIGSAVGVVLPVALALVPVGVARAASPPVAPVNSYTPYATTTSTGEPSIGYDPLRNVVLYGAGRRTSA